MTSSCSSFRSRILALADEHEALLQLISVSGPPSARLSASVPSVRPLSPRLTQEVGVSGAQVSITAVKASALSEAAEPSPSDDTIRGGVDVESGGDVNNASTGRVLPPRCTGRVYRPFFVWNLNSTPSGFSDEAVNPAFLDKTFSRFSSANFSSSSLECTETQQHYQVFFEQYIVLDPGSSLRLVWDAFGVATLLWDVLWVPMQVFDPPSSDAITALFWFTMLYWNVDFLVSFATGYFHHGVLISDFRKIAARYMTSWMTVDASLLLMDWVLIGIESGSSGQVRLGRSLRIVRFLRMIRLIRISKLNRMINIISEALYIDMDIKVFITGKLALGILISTHLLACIWYAMGNWDASDFEGGYTWLQVILEDDRCSGCVDSFWFRYTMSLLWSVSQLGFGSADAIQPTNVWENGLSIFVVVLSLFLVSSTVSAVTNQMAQSRISQMELSSQFDTLRRFCRKRRMPRDVCMRIMRFAKSMQSQSRWEFDLEAIRMVEQLSGPLKAELSYYNHRDLFLNQPLLANFIRGTRQYIMHKIAKQAVDTRQYAADDLVFSSGEQCGATVCIEMGVARYKKSRKATQFMMGVVLPSMGMPTMEDGMDMFSSQWFCEAALFTVWHHVGNLRAISNCRLLTIDPQQFGDIISLDLEVWRKTSMYVESFLTCLNEKRDDGSLSDVDMVDTVVSATDTSSTRKSCCQKWCRRNLEARSKRRAELRSQMTMGYY